MTVSEGTAAIATSDPRATQAGAKMLRGGANAVDAAVTAAFVLMVVEPHACGVGGDGFLLCRRRGLPPEALNGAGKVPDGLTMDALLRDGFDAVPIDGPRSVTVPGVVDLLSESLDRYGTVSLGQAIEPAVRLAEEGFDVRPTLAAACFRNTTMLERDPVLSAILLPRGTPPAAGTRIRNPGLAAYLRTLASEGPQSFYDGEVAASIVAAIQGGGGYLSAADLAGHRTAPMVPLGVDFRDKKVWELPEPTYGKAASVAIEALSEARTCDWPAVVEAVMKGLNAVGVNLANPVPAASHHPRGDTTNISCIDSDRTTVSLMFSLFSDFGSGVGVDAIGGPMHNRAAGFGLVGLPPRPGQPPHTLVPTLVTDDHNDDELALSVAGGYMQVQGQVQLLVRLLAHHEALEPAIAAPRFRIVPGGHLALEPSHPLAEMYPESVGRDPGPGGFGGAQAALRRSGSVTAVADARRMGSAVSVGG
jgi:gamma-glutamyltranspeptidase/glutathione hydrolase